MRIKLKHLSEGVSPNDLTSENPDPAKIENPDIRQQETVQTRLRIHLRTLEHCTVGGIV